MSAPPIILFDGVCNLCSRSVRFIVRRDPRKRFRFAPLQSETGRALLRRHGRDPDDLDTLVLVEDGAAYVRSTAALRIARRLAGLWPVLSVLLVVPRPIRDWAYRLVARRRYRWFGKRDVCFVPGEGMADRFLEPDGVSAAPTPDRGSCSSDPPC